jgi:hypothetical protein
MHEDIKTFTLDGKIDDSNLVQGKDRLIEFVETQMRDLGAVPVLDLEPQFTLDYIPELERYDFKLTLYGITVGEEDAWQIGGMMNGKLIPRYIPKDK